MYYLLKTLKKNLMFTFTESRKQKEINISKVSHPFNFQTPGGCIACYIRYIRYDRALADFIMIIKRFICFVQTITVIWLNLIFKEKVPCRCYTWKKFMRIEKFSEKITNQLNSNSSSWSSDEYHRPILHIPNPDILN